MGGGFRRTKQLLTIARAMLLDAGSLDLDEAHINDFDTQHRWVDPNGND